MSGVLDWRWPHFTRKELSCHCGYCGDEYFHYPEFLDALEKAREILGKPIIATNWHRCMFHNAMLGSGEGSQHRRLAGDIDLRGRDRFEYLRAFRMAGFQGFGFYKNMLHIDMGRERFWFGKREYQELWRL